MFRAAGVLPGVVNLVIHRPEDAQGYSKALISHPARECNFTGSTAVGRQVTARAAMHLRPVLMGLGGKDCAVVLQNVDLKRAAEMVLLEALLNTGHICMSMDLVSVARSIEPEYNALLCKTARRTRTSWQTHPGFAPKKTGSQVCYQDLQGPHA
ncbi:hypothetical protein MCOR20_009918 [Pyricularia oryzae]|nr:hypothetical protein MCOR20_009918 [Pyricularia oryzae]